MYLHKEGKIAEYTIDYADQAGAYYDITHRPDTKIHFENRVWVPAEHNYIDGYFEQHDNARLAAIDYHENEGCALYLELYPAPEKGDWAFIAQDADGEWCGYDHKPDLKEDAWVERTSLDWHHICKSPPNPFWRKTLR